MTTTVGARGVETVDEVTVDAAGSRRARVGSAMLGIGWRPEVAGVAADRTDLGFAEVVAESVPCGDRPLPLGLADLLDRGIPVLTHGIGLSLGSAERPSRPQLDRLADAATRMGSPLVSEHLAIVRAGGRAAGHLLPVPRTRAMARVLAENIRIAQDHLPVPLAIESPAALLDWPGDELDEADFVTEVVERSGATLLLDLANLYVNARNRGADPFVVLERMPLERLAYAHVAGGHVHAGTYHDTHAAPVWADVLDLTSVLVARVPDARVMLERDDRFGSAADLDAELDAIASALAVPATARWCPVRAETTARGRAPAADPVSIDDRDRVRITQIALVDAVLGGAPPPAGFDRDQVDLVRRSLRAKRTREVAVRWPATAAWLGSGFIDRFGAYADRQPVPDGGGPFADGAAFICGLGRGAGDDAARREWQRAGVAGPRWRRRW